MSNEGGNDHAVRTTLIHGLEHAHIRLHQEVGAKYPRPTKTDLNTQDLPLNPLLHNRDVARTLQAELRLLKGLVHTLLHPRSQENLAPPVIDATPTTIIQVINQTLDDPLITVIEVIVKTPRDLPLDTENDTMAATLRSAVDVIATHLIVKAVIENQPPQNKVSRQSKNDMTPPYQYYLPFKNSLPYDLRNRHRTIDPQVIETIEANPHATNIDTTDLITGKSCRITRNEMKRRRRMETSVDEVFVTKTILSGLHVKQNANAINNDGDRFFFHSRNETYYF